MNWELSLPIRATRTKLSTKLPKEPAPQGRDALKGKSLQKGGYPKSANIAWLLPTQQIGAFQGQHSVNKTP